MAALIRWLRRDAAVPLTAGLVVPAAMGALAVGRLVEAVWALAIAIIAVVAQRLISVSARRHWQGHRRDVHLIQLAVALIAAGVLIEVVVPGSFALYVPVVATAAFVGTREAIVVGLGAMILFLLPVAAAPGSADPAGLSRGVAGAAVSALVAAGARHFAGAHEGIVRELRRSARRERRRSRQLSGLEDVSRLLASAGPTRAALARVTDVLVERFSYRYVSIYIARPDGVLELGAQRGYASAIETLDVSRGIVGRVMRHGRPELIRDVSQDPDYVAADPRVISGMAAPLIEGDHTLGVLSVEAVGTRLDETDLQAVISVADRLAAYIALGRERHRLAELAVRDPLTGLHNGRYLDDRVEALFAARSRLPAENRKPLSIVLFDLDFFGAVNKQHGHRVGDDVLRSVAATIASNFRPSDTVARYGGEEFVVVLDAPLRIAQYRAERVRAAIERATIDVTGAPRVTISAGCAALRSTDTASWDDVRAVADVALGMAKRAGRNQVVSAAV